MSVLLEIAQRLSQPRRFERLGRRLAGLREDWPGALRMVLATVLSLLVSRALRLPESYWAVLSALIVARPDAGSSAKAGASRLIGTVVGSGVATLLVTARSWHVPEIVLLAAAMVPLSAFVMMFEEYRTAPVAAIIILSSGSAAVSPLNIALLRVAEIAVGSLVSTVVAATVLPSRGHARPAALGAAILTRIGSVLAKTFENDRDAAHLDESHDRLRRDLRELGALLRMKAAADGRARAHARMLRLLSRLQADTSFVGRLVAADTTLASESEFPRAVNRVCADVAAYIMDPESSDEQLQRCSDALATASRNLVDGRPTGAHGNVSAMSFLLETLGRDLHDLIRLFQGVARKRIV
jgi:uncharacterized membrane protein YccC